MYTDVYAVCCHMSMNNINMISKADISSHTPKQDYSSISIFLSRIPL